MATYTLTGPTSGVQSVASSPFTVTMDATAITGSVVVTPNDQGQGGTFNPTSLTFTAASQAKTFTYTPVNTGIFQVGTSTNNVNYTDPNPIIYNVSLNKDNVINALLYILSHVHGYNFPYYELTRTGNISHADAISLRDSFNAYVTQRANRPPLTPAHPDTASQIHTTDIEGRTGTGITDAQADVGQTGGGTVQTGR